GADRGRAHRASTKAFRLQAARRDGAAQPQEGGGRSERVEAGGVPGLVPVEDRVYAEAPDLGGTAARRPRLDGGAVLRARRVRADGGRARGGLRCAPANDNQPGPNFRSGAASAGVLAPASCFSPRSASWSAACSSTGRRNSGSGSLSARSC